MNIMNNKSKAISYLEKNLSEGSWKPGDRLPTIIGLTHDAGVSDYSMRRAIKDFAQKGLLSVEWGSGIRVSQPDGFKHQTVSLPEEKWRTIRNKIANDMFGHVLDAFSPLPSIQELCHRYGTSYPIIKKALGSLVNNGLLISYKRTYKPNLLSTSVYKSKILVMMEIDPDKLNKDAINFQGKGFKLSPREMPFLYKMERLSNIQNFSFDVWGYSHQNNLTTYYNPEMSPCHSLENKNFYYGICLIKQQPFTEDFSRMLSQIAGLSIPVSIMDESGSESFWPFPRTKNRSIRVFHVAASDLAGQKIGQHLLQYGHREIAYFSPWFREGWTKNRYVGLCKAFALVSDANAVHLFVDNRYPVGSIHLKTDRFDNKSDNTPSLEKIVQSNKILSGESAKNFISEMEREFRHSISVQRMGIFMQPFFEQALAKSKVTAWVCADYQIALSAMRFLHNKGVSIPGEISVAGFDESNERAYSSGLTTYDYDTDGVTQTMVAFISNPAIFPEKQGLFLEKNGFLVPRQSTGPARKETGV